ncbi:endogenous retrovirus group 3 member 1, partial [Chelydra serpentina]
LCAKLNESNCCLQIDDNGQAVKQLTKEMRKITHVPVQTWNGWDTDWFTSWLLQWGWLRKGFLLYTLYYRPINNCLLCPMLNCNDSQAGWSSYIPANDDIV